MTMMIRDCDEQKVGPDAALSDVQNNLKELCLTTGCLHTATGAIIERLEVTMCRSGIPQCLSILYQFWH